MPRTIGFQLIVLWSVTSLIKVYRWRTKFVTSIFQTQPACHIYVRAAGREYTDKTEIMGSRPNL